MELVTQEHHVNRLYMKCEGVVLSFVESFIENDINVVIPSWLHFRLDNIKTPIDRLKDLFFILFRNDIEIEITTGYITIFRDSPENMSIPIGELCITTTEHISAMMKYGDLFFQEVENKGLRYWVYKQFRFNHCVRASELWKLVVTKFMSLILQDNVNLKYLGGKGEQIMLCFVVDEISISYEDYCKRAQGDGSEWRRENIRYVQNLSLLYNELRKEIGMIDKEESKVNEM